MPIAVAWREEQRRFQIPQDFSQKRIFVVGAMVDAVACVDNGINIPSIDIGNASPQIFGTRFSVSR